MTGRLKVALLFGGRSAEHDVSVLSAANVFSALDPERYDVVPIAITRDGTWLLCEIGDAGFPSVVPGDGSQVALLPGAGGHYIVLAADKAPQTNCLDVIFPVLHGPFGEDGTVQGAAELAGVAYVGSDVLGSAAAMDKDVAKRLLAQAGLPVAGFRVFTADAPPAFDAVAAALGRPLFVKPARLGSSVGVTRATSAREFDAAVRLAFQHDRKILVEACVEGREVECGVLQNPDGSLFVSVPGEIIPTGRHGFYSYQAKYLDADGAVLKVPADLPDAVRDTVRALSAQAFGVLGCGGLARIDVFVRPDATVLINEVNTLPGFTAISMYPKVLAASGVGYPELVRRLIDHAIHRARR